MATIYIRETQPTEADVAAMARLKIESFAGQAIPRAMFPGGSGSAEEELAYRRGQISRDVAGPGRRWLAAYTNAENVDGTSQEILIGWALWMFPPPPGQEMTVEQAVRARQLELSARPSTMDQEATEQIIEGGNWLFETMRGDHDPRDFWVLAALCVHPRHQRKGAGRMMARWGIERAAREGKGVLLTSSPAGFPLYLALGFKPCGGVPVLDEMHVGMRILPPGYAEVRSEQDAFEEELE